MRAMILCILVALTIVGGATQAEAQNVTYRRVAEPRSIQLLLHTSKMTLTQSCDLMFCNKDARLCFAFLY